MKKTLLLLSFALCANLGFAQTSAPAPTAASTQAAKDAATGFAGMMRGSSPVLVNGEVQRTTNNNATMERTSSNSQKSQMEYFQSVTGISGATAEGTGRDGTLGASSAINTYVDFSCKTESAARKTAGGYVFQLESCAQSGTSVQSVTLKMCSALQRGGSCSEASAFSTPTVLASGSYATVDGVKLGLGCNDSNSACRLSVSASYTMATRTADYDKTVQDQVTANGNDANSAQGSITAMRTKTNEKGQNAYEAAMVSDGRDMVDCAKDNNERTKAGLPAITCDGKQTVQVQQAPANAPPVDCNSTGLCVRTGVKTTTFSRSCTRTYPLTSKICEMQTKTKACTVTWVDSEDKDDKGVPLKVESNSCAPADLEGASKFNSADTTCAVERKDGEKTVCERYNRTDYYSWAPKATGACYGDPYKVGGSCTTDASQTDTQCPAGNWFGRTKTDTECTMLLDEGRTMQVGESVIAGCGVCPASKTGTLCYAATPLTRDPLSLSEYDRQDGGFSVPTESEDSCAAVDLNGCSLTSSDQVANNETGMVTSRRETYTCTKQTESCLEYAAKDARCSVTTVDNFGLDKEGFRAGASDEAMNSALANTAVLNSIGGAASEGKLDVNGATIVPLLFQGEAQDCERPTGSWGSNGYYQDCCRISLERPEKKTGKVNECTEEDARLAAARRANYTVLIGTQCSKKAPWPLSKCIRERQVYCAFPGVLPRIIHEQGRKQLAEMAKSGSSAQTEKALIKFNYYGTTGTWSAPVKANNVSLAAWQWPSYCRDLGEAAKALSKDPTAKDCATRLTNYFAVCDNPAGCGELPVYPELGSERWRISTTDPLQAVTTAVSNYAVVNGSCDPTSSECDYEMSAWPAGVGGRAVVRKYMSFPVYVAAGSTAKGDLVNIGDFMFQPMSTAVAGGAFPTSMPATVRLNFSSDGGQSWRPIDIPTSDSKEMTLPGSDAKLSGSCQLGTNTCQFALTGTATVKAMDWGNVNNPNCEGFTPGQLAVLDFGKMDLSEWLSTVASNIKAPSAGGMAAVATTQMTEFNQNFQSGKASTVTMAAPQGAQFAKVSPAEGFGPFDVSVKVGGYWPVTYGDPAKDTDKVTAVSVDWGDCTIGDSASVVTNVNGQAAHGFIASHRYTRPRDIPAACGGGGNPQANLTHTVKLKVSTSKSGVQTVTLQVKNAHNTMPGAYQTNTGGSVNHTPTTSATIPASNTPPGK